MKKLKRMELKEFHEMTDFEMRNVMGGYDDSDQYRTIYPHLSVCIGTKDWKNSYSPVQCTDNASDAIDFAGDNGSWCCNCRDAYRICGNYT